MINRSSPKEKLSFDWIFAKIHALSHYYSKSSILMAPVLLAGLRVFVAHL